MEDREKLRMHKYTETTKDSNYDGNSTSRHFRFGTCIVSGRVIFVYLLEAEDKA